MSKHREKESALLCSRRLRVLADRTRLGVVEELMKRPLCVSELQGHIGISQSLLSHHLKVLRDAGLVTTRRKGKSVQYRLVGAQNSKTRAVDLGCCKLSFAD